MIQFIYTKENGDRSDRLCITINKPSDNYLMVDLSDLDTDEMDAVEQRVAAFLAERNDLIKKHKLNTYVKSFKKGRMSGIIDDV